MLWSKTLTLGGLVILASACSSREPAIRSQELSLADAPRVLDLSMLLPSNFEHLDAVKEGYSHKDLGLSSDASEVVLYASVQPYGIVYTYLSTYDKRIQQFGMDDLLRDDKKALDMVEVNMKSLAGKGGADLISPKFEVSHPTVGDLSILVEGSAMTHGIKDYFDFLCFRVSRVYVYVYAIYNAPSRFSLVPIGTEIAQRIVNFKPAVAED